MNPPRLVTIKDVAKEAGVSIGAVSKVLHGRGGNIRVGEATAERIRDAARALSYRPNYHARSLRSGKSRSVGLVADAPFLPGAKGMYQTHLLERLLGALHAKGYTLNLAPELMPLADIQGLSDGRFDGLVWLDSAPAGPLIEAFYESPVPVVAIGGEYERTPERGAVFLPDEAAGRGLLFDHITEMGHASLMYSDVPAALATRMSRMRRDGVIQEARKRGCRLQVASADNAEDAMSQWSEYRLIPTAILAHSDRHGAMLMDVARRTEISVPNDVSIAAFDGCPVTLWAWPGLTTVRPSVDTLVDRASDHLIRQMERQPTEAVSETFPSMMSVAGSTATPSARS